MSVCCDYDPPEFHSETERKARKEYRCEECRKVIAAGERYVYISGKWEGYLDQFRWCVGCRDARDLFVHHDQCGCWAYGNLLGDIEDSWKEGPGALWLGRLLVAMRAQWKAPYDRLALVGPRK